MTRCKVRTKTPVYSYSDDFSTAGAIASPWVDGHSVKPNGWEPLGARSGAAVIWTDRTRSGTYQTDQSQSPPSPPGTLYSAIGCAWHSTGGHLPDISLTWPGYFSHSGNPNQHVEATPLLYIDPENPLGGFGVWPAAVGSNAALFGGYIGQPAENFNVVALGNLGAYTDGVPHTLRLTAVAKGRVVVFWDGVQVPMTRNATTNAFNYRGPLDPIDVVPSLTSSTLHGFALDGHLVLPTSNATTTAGAYDFAMEVL